MRLRNRHAAPTLLGLVLLFALALPVAAQRFPLAAYPYDEGDRPRGIATSILLYPVNRVADFFDTFSFNMGFGLGLHVNVHATRLLQFGLGTSVTSKVGRPDAKREFGVYQETRSDFSLLLLSLGTLKHVGTLGTVADYHSATEPDRLYLVKRDVVGIGAELTALILSLNFEIHPAEIFDFILGFLTLDVMGDDL